MVIDHQKALVFTLNKAKEKLPITETLIKEIGTLVVKNTGSGYNTVLGSFDSTKGGLSVVKRVRRSEAFPRL